MANFLRNYTPKLSTPFRGKHTSTIFHLPISNTESRTVNYMALIGYASQTFTEDGESTSKWSEDFHKLMAEANLTTHDITMLLSLLSASVRNASALPPYLRAPKPFGLTTKLEELDSDILSVRHIAEPGYSAFAVIQICSRSVVAELEVILKYVSPYTVHGIVMGVSGLLSNTLFQKCQRAGRRTRFLLSYHQHR